jgi:hypothetical protein
MYGNCQSAGPGERARLLLVTEKGGLIIQGGSIMSGLKQETSLIRWDREPAKETEALVQPRPNHVPFSMPTFLCR